MDSENQCSVALESVEDNEVLTPESLGNDNQTKIETNGTCHDTDFEGVSIKSPSATMQSPLGLVGSSPLTVTKGFGLKKWRRIRREGGNEVGSNLDSGKALKRGLSNSVGNANSTRSTHAVSEMKQKREGSVSSTNAVVKVLVNAPDGTAMYGADSGSVGGPIFAAGTDSENSEDCSSKSSTAATAPRSRYEIPAAVGYGRDNNKMSVSGKSLGSSVSAQRSAQQGRSRIETSKKVKGERVKIEKENSHSSMESDSRSSNFVFMQGRHSVTSNGRQSGRSANYDGENSDDAQDGEQHFNEDIRTGFSINEAESKDASQEDLAADLSWGMEENKSENHGSLTDQDAWMESIIALQSAQEALEKEVEKLRFMGKDDTLLFDDSVQAEGLPSEFKTVGPEVHDPSPFDHESLEKQMISLKENVIHLQSKLLEARLMFDMKEAKVLELEAILNSSKSPKEERGSTIEMELENHRDIETELEGIFRQKIEAEIEHLAILKTIETLRVEVVDQITFLEEQKALASKQIQVLNKLENAENKATMLKTQAEKLETSCEEIVEAHEVLKLQTRVCKFTSCFLVQLILLVLVLGLFVSQLSPLYGDVVPT